MKAAEETAKAMSIVPFHRVINVLMALINTRDNSPIASIKMLTKLVEAHADEVTDGHLKEIMPILIKVFHKFYRV